MVFDYYKAMKTGVISILAFGILNDIATLHQVKAKEWARESWGNDDFVSRISELRKLYNLEKSGQSDTEKVGRVLSAEKAQSLLTGLKAILGADTVKHELLRKLKTVKTDRERNLILVMAAEDNDQTTIRLFIEALLTKKK
jgi:hypothetical protein